MLAGLLTPTLLVLAVFGGHRAWTWQSEKRLANYVEGLRKNGEGASLAELIPPPSPDSLNAAADIRSASEMLSAESDEVLTAFFSMPSIGLPLNGQEQAMIRHCTARYGTALGLVRSAMSKPTVNWATPLMPGGRQQGGPSWGRRGYGFFRQRGVAQLLYASCLISHIDGDEKAALRRVEELLFLSRANAERPSRRGQETGLWMSELALAALNEILPDLVVGQGARQAPPEQVKAIITTLLDEAHTRAAVVNCLRVERARHIDWVMAPRPQDAESMRVQETFPLGDPLPMPMPGSSSLERFVMRPVYLDRVREAFRRLDVGIASFNSPDLRAFYEAFADSATSQDEPVAPEFEDPERPGHDTPADYQRLLTASVQQAGKYHYISMAHRRTTALALAISMYRGEHGKFPANLQALVPDYLPAIPSDPLSAVHGSVAYSPDARRPRVYTVGEDGIDDGGWPADPAASRAEDMRMTDWVVDLVRQPRFIPTPSNQQSPPDNSPRLPFRGFGNS